MTTSEWYVSMGEAVKERNRALSMVENWQEKVQAAEARIQALAAENSGPVETAENTEAATEQV
jgi:hypothetical protein